MIKVRVELTKSLVYSEVRGYRAQWRPVTIFHSETSRQRPVRSVLDRPALAHRTATVRLPRIIESSFFNHKNILIINKTVHQCVSNL